MNRDPTLVLPPPRGVRGTALVLANAVGFQLVWFASVIGAGHGLWWPGPAALALFASWQLHVSRCRRADLQVAGVAVLAGLVLDSALAAGGLLEYAAPVPSPALAPVWILSLWAGFALTLNHSLAFLRPRPAWALAFGAVGGPLAYLAAARVFAAVALTAPTATVLAVLAVGWGLLTPALCTLAGRLDRTPSTRAPA